MYHRLTLLIVLMASVVAQFSSTAFSDTPKPAAGRVYVVAQADPAAKDDGPGTAQQPFKTISRAAEMAEPGDTVLVHQGVYRERVAPARSGTEDHPITYEAAPGESVVVKGSDIWKPGFEPVAGHPDVYLGRFDPKLFSGPNPYLLALEMAPHNDLVVHVARPISALDDTAKKWQATVGQDRLPLTIGQVFVDGKYLVQTETVQAVYDSPDKWIVAPDGQGILIHFDPSDLPFDQRVVELSVRDRIFASHRRGLTDIRVRGFVFEHCCNQGPFPQIGAVSCRSGRRWVFENNTICFANTVGLDIGGEEKNTTRMPDTVDQDRKTMAGIGIIVRNNIISDNGLAGIDGWSARGSKIIGNILERNNNLYFAHGAGFGGHWLETAAIKLHGSDALIEGNLIRNNECFGVWFDNGYSHARITRNIILDNRLAGIMMELGDGPALIDDNILAYNTGDGFYSHDASGLTVAHNLMYRNGDFGAWMHVVSDRIFRGHPVEASNERIVDNLIIGNFRGSVCLPPNGKRSHDNECDHNVYLDGAWMTTFRKPEFMVNSNNGRNHLEIMGGTTKPDQPADAETQDERPTHMMDLATWTKITGFDAHSAIAKVGANATLRSNVGNLEISFDDSITRDGSASVAGLDCDLLGHAIPRDHAVPGPFQNLKVGSNMIYFWPLPAVDRANYRPFIELPATQPSSNP